MEQVGMVVCNAKCTFCVPIWISNISTHGRNGPMSSVCYSLDNGLSVVKIRSIPGTVQWIRGAEAFFREIRYENKRRADMHHTYGTKAP